MAKSKIFCVFDPDCVPICLGEIGIDLHGVNGTGSTGDGGSMTAEPAVWHFLNTTSAAHTAHASAALHEPILVSATLNNFKLRVSGNTNNFWKNVSK